MARGSVDRAARASRHRTRGGERVARHRELRGQRQSRDRDDGPHDGRRTPARPAAPTSRGQRIPPNTPTPLDPNGVVAFGPIPVPVSLLGQLAQAFAGGAAGSHARGRARRPAPAAAMHAASAAAPAARGEPAARPKHRTVIGELKLDQLQGAVITIGRTPDNDIVVPHPQVVARHAQITNAGRPALPRGSRQRQRHVRARPAHRARPEGPRRRTARRSTSARCRC